MSKEFKPLRFVYDGKYYVAQVYLPNINYWISYTYKTSFDGYIYASSTDSNSVFKLYCNDHNHVIYDIKNQMEKDYQKLMTDLYSKLQSYRME